MTGLMLLPSTTYRPPSPQARRRGRSSSLNPIIEEVDVNEPRRTMNRQAARPHPGRSADPSTLKIEQWLSPLSDHFPTPRGLHFLAAPVLPATPTCAEEIDDVSSVGSASNPSTNMWNRQSVGTDVTEFDIYDASDDEQVQARKSALMANGISRQRGSKGSSRRRMSTGSRKSLTPLVIPGGSEAKKVLSPVPPTPPTKVEMSPAVKSFMKAQQAVEVPTISAPPSLDGSLNSEEMAVMSAPPTPLINAADEGEVPWSGVHLQPGALETLNALSGSETESNYEEHHSPVIEVAQEMSETRQQPSGLLPTFPQPPAASRPIAKQPSLSERTFAGLTKLDIPSPGGFFSELSSASRQTWQEQPQQDDVAPATSTTAEQFYRFPWSTDNVPPPPTLPFSPAEGKAPIVERFVEVPDINMQDLPTAVRVQATPITAIRIPPATPSRAAKAVQPAPAPAPKDEPTSPLVATEILAPNYAAKMQEQAESHFDRTKLWLMAQRNYMQGVTGFSEEHEPEQEDAKVASPAPAVVKKHAETLEKLEQKPPVPAKDTPVPEQKKKAVRFSEVATVEKIPRSLPSKLTRQESAYYRAFADASVRRHTDDVFVHKQARFEALQAQRVALREQHRNQLLGKFQLSVVPQSAKKRMSANVARGDDQLVDDPEKLKADKEADALTQMSMASWHVAATKLLNGGRLVAAPVAKRLARLSTMAPDKHGVTRDRARILDLGGMGTCDWAWHVAMQYPNTKIYTVTTKTMRQLSNSNIRGPPNHRQVAVESLARLPFADGQFDLVSARELHAALKVSGEHGVDEWDACLAECMRVLKPGGYIEFSVLDADIVNAGPAGNAKAVEFGFALQTLGYDPTPTRSFVGRLRRAGFDDVRRAWVCLPMGPKAQPGAAAKKMPNGNGNGKVVELEAMVSGSADHAAAVTGFAAGWSWERWLLRAEMEKAAGELRLADIATSSGPAMQEASKMIANVHAVVEEGRNVGSAFRLLRGYARKPTVSDLQRMGTIKMMMDF